MIGKVYIELDNVSSTNEYAKVLLAKNKPKEGTAIFASHQWQGKGQYGNKWQSVPGKNILLSVIVYPSQLHLQRFFYLNIVTTLAINDMISATTGCQTAIKWPNDIVASISGQEGWAKLAGILIENILHHNTVGTSILGMGINVNQNHFGGPTAGGASLKTMSGQSWDLRNLIHHLFHTLEQRYDQLNAGQYQELKRAYLANLVGWNDKQLYKDDKEQFYATLLDVQDDGQIKLLSEQGIRQYHFKEVHPCL